MTSLDTLRHALGLTPTATTASSSRLPLSSTENIAGWEILTQGLGLTTNVDLVATHVSQLLGPLFASRNGISVLEIGPGSKGIVSRLPENQRRKIKRYTAFEPIASLASKCEKTLSSVDKSATLLPGLNHPPDVRPSRVDATDPSGRDSSAEKYDLILFCRSNYAFESKKTPAEHIEQTLEMLPERLGGEMVVVVFHDWILLPSIGGLVPRQTTLIPTRVVRVEDDDESLDTFSRAVAGFVMQDETTDKSIQLERRKMCRALGRREEAHPGRLIFDAPQVMMAFTRHATALPELTAKVPLAPETKMTRIQASGVHIPAARFRPTEVKHVQKCVQWALKHKFSLTVIGGEHSSHCVWPNVVAIDMGAFDKVHFHIGGLLAPNSHDPVDLGPFVVAEAGCKTRDIVQETLGSGVTVPLGSHPSVGAGLWLQGGIGHLTRLQGLSCDAIVGAVVVGLESGEVFVVGRVPTEHQPKGAVRPPNEADLLWALRGAGTNFGIVISVVFKTFAAPTYLYRNWIVPLSSALDAERRLREFDELLARKLARNFSVNAYLYWEADSLHLRVTAIKTFKFGDPGTTASTFGWAHATQLFGPEDEVRVVDSVGLFGVDPDISEMHSGHGGSKTSSFKRCLFLKGIGAPEITKRLVAAIETSPSPLCYLQLLQGGAGVHDIAPESTAFDCRDWDFACVVTGVWLSEKDMTEASRAAVQWVYDVSKDLLPLSAGAYGADLGPDPRDAGLAAAAFGPHRPRLARLRRTLDPGNVLAHACPLPKAPMEPKLIILVTGEHGAGKDFCARHWLSVFTAKNIKAQVVDIADTEKREDAAAKRDRLDILLGDSRGWISKTELIPYTEQPRSVEERFLDIVYAAVDVDVLLITGVRREAPIAGFSHLVPSSHLMEVRVQASEETIRLRRGYHEPSPMNRVDGAPTLIFDNETLGSEAVEKFAENRLLHYARNNLDGVVDVMPTTPDFPRAGINFRHVLNIVQRPAGLAYISSLLRGIFAGSWDAVGAVVSCETGGFIFAAPLVNASRTVPLVLIREAGKLPPPTISVTKESLHISPIRHTQPVDRTQETFEMDRDVIPRGASVVVVEDVLATGRTLCTVLRLLKEAGVGAEQVSVLVVAEFPIHRGRELLRQRGFGKVRVQSLLIFDGA